jgi:hypothetical protein
MLGESNTVFMLEVLLQRHVYGRPLELKQDAALRESVLVIFDCQVEAGSSAASRALEIANPGCAFVVERPSRQVSVRRSILVEDDAPALRVQARFDVIVRVFDGVAGRSIAHLDQHDVRGSAIDQMVSIAIARLESDAHPRGERALSVVRHERGVPLQHVDKFVLSRVRVPKRAPRAWRQARVVHAEVGEPEWIAKRPFDSAARALSERRWKTRLLRSRWRVGGNERLGRSTNVRHPKSVSQAPSHEPPKGALALAT